MNFLAQDAYIEIIVHVPYENQCESFSLIEYQDQIKLADFLSSIDDKVKLLDVLRSIASPSN